MRGDRFPDPLNLVAGHGRRLGPNMAQAGGDAINFHWRRHGRLHQARTACRRDARGVCARHRFSLHDFLARLRSRAAHAQSDTWPGNTSSSITHGLHRLLRANGARNWRRIPHAARPKPDRPDCRQRQAQHRIAQDRQQRGEKELVLACILRGVRGFRGLPNPVFKRHLRNLRMLVSLDPMAQAREWNAAAKKCWPRELED